MKKLALVLLAVLMLSTSCDLMMEDPMPKPRMYLIACGLGYEGLEGTELINPLNDACAITDQFKELCRRAGNDYEIVWYSDNFRWVPGSDTLTNRRFSFTHYNSKSDEPAEPPVLLTAVEGPMGHKTLEEKFFGAIEGLWDTMPTENDLIIFYFSGHGVDSLTNEYNAGPALFYTSDTARGPVTISTYTTLNYDTICRNMDKYPARQLFIIDCCYAGADHENQGTILPRNDNELAYSLFFQKAYETNGARNDQKIDFNCGLFIENSWNSTFDGNGAGKPRRMVINAATYAQQSRNSDIQRSAEKGIAHYGGFTYRLLKYLGYQMTDNVETDKAGFPARFEGKVISASGMMKGVYNNISSWLREIATPNMTRSSFDMAIWDFRK